MKRELKIFKNFFDGLKKADWDVGLAVDAIKISSSIDTIVLVSGDGDFIPLVEYLKNQGKRVEVMAFSRSASLHLKEVADEFLDLSLSPEKYLIKTNSIKRGDEKF